MNNLQKMGGIASLLMAGAYLVGFGLYFFLLDSSGYAGPFRNVAFLVDNKTTMYIGNLVIYVAASIFLVVLVIALYERLKDGLPAIVQTATAFGLIWAGLVIASGMIYNIGMDTVASLYSKDPAQAANEIVGGLWVLLLSWAALRKGALSRALNYLGVVVGVAGIFTVVPAFSVLTEVFGLSQIVWFIWLGIVMLRSSHSFQNAQPENI